MNKFNLSVLALVCSTALAGCGGGSSNSPKQDTPNKGLKESTDNLAALCKNEPNNKQCEVKDKDSANKVIVPPLPVIKEPSKKPYVEPKAILPEQKEPELIEPSVHVGDSCAGGAGTVTSVTANTATCQGNEVPEQKPFVEPKPILPEQKTPEVDPKLAWIDENTETINALSGVLNVDEIYYLCGMDEYAGCEYGKNPDGSQGSFYVNLYYKDGEDDTGLIQYYTQSEVNFNVDLNRFEFSRTLTYTVPEIAKQEVEQLDAWKRLAFAKYYEVGFNTRIPFKFENLTVTKRNKIVGHGSINYSSMGSNGKFVTYSGETDFVEYEYSHVLSLTPDSKEEIAMLQEIKNDLDQGGIVANSIIGFYDYNDGYTGSANMIYLGGLDKPSKDIQLLLSKFVN
ncbi:hypothetical protein [Vibrio parahaemolyticus]|uniref:hypothetical protein n=1 Tax=Vibrio parahaemolyticus TaxID=670 RepID=UPI00226B0EA9|nr:hypothetical protein [Vibrio parahaemolyticus]MCX8941260.1 hypothetical protein [Vibrio parahaemolyticus]